MPTLYVLMYIVASTLLLILGGAGYALGWLASLCIYAAGILIGVGVTRLVTR